MKQSTHWQDIMKVRNNNKIEFGKISLKRKTLEHEFKKVLMSVLKEVLNPECKSVCIDIREKESTANVNLIGVSVMGLFNGPEEVLFWDCECDYLFDKFKEVLSEYGFKFATDKYIEIKKWGRLVIDL